MKPIPIILTTAWLTACSLCVYYEKQRLNEASKDHIIYREVLPDHMSIMKEGERTYAIIPGIGEMKAYRTDEHGLVIEVHNQQKWLTNMNWK